MQAERIRPVRRTRREHTRQRQLRMRSRMNLKNIPFPLMQPGNDDDFIPCREPLDPRHRERFDVQPNIGAPSEPCFGALLRFLIGDRITPIGRRRQPRIFPVIDSSLPRRLRILANAESAATSHASFAIIDDFVAVFAHQAALWSATITKCQFPISFILVQRVTDLAFSVDIRTTMQALHHGPCELMSNDWLER